MLAAKEVSLCGGYDKNKSQNIGFFDYSRTHGKTISP
jgi:hypothetical protein